tara:strand:+ start:120 stop:308 length:189 start_codon:yes stop_codon:yes gene_type:complete
MSSNIKNDHYSHVDPNKRAIIRRTWREQGKPLLQDTYKSNSTYIFMDTLKEIQKNQLPKGSL